MRVRFWLFRQAKVVERWLDTQTPTLVVLIHLIIRRMVRDPVLWAIERLIRRGDVVLDIGANRGVYTYRMAKLVGKSGHVHSFEPGPKLNTLAAVCRRLYNVTIYGLGLSNRKGKAILRIPLDHGIRLDPLATLEASAGASSSVVVEVARLDDLDLRPHPSVSFVKCDVEGHELAVINGAEATLRNHMPLLLIEIDQRLTAGPIEATFDRLKEFGYQGFAVRRDGLRPLHQFDKETEQLAHTKWNSPYDLVSSGTIDFLFVSQASHYRVEPLLQGSPDENEI